MVKEALKAEDYEIPNSSRLLLHTLGTLGNVEKDNIRLLVFEGVCFCCHSWMAENLDANKNLDVL